MYRLTFGTTKFSITRASIASAVLISSSIFTIIKDSDCEGALAFIKEILSHLVIMPNGYNLHSY